MAHNINSLAFVGEVPWHGLGRKLDAVATAEEVIEAAEMDWEVEKRQVYYKRKPTDMGIIVPEHFATVRTDNGVPLGVVGKKYTALQNKDAFTFFDSIVGEGEAIYHTAGVLGQGETVWILAKLPADIIIKSEDKVEQYLLLSNTHDGSSSVRCKFSGVRVVCANTLNMALGSKRGRAGESEARIRHTRNIKERMKQAHELIGIVARHTIETGELFEAMAGHPVDSEIVNSFVYSLIPDNPNTDNNKRTENAREKVTNLFENSETLADVATHRTLWGLYNAVTEFTTHVKGVRGEDDARMRSVMFGGSGEQMNQRALSLAMNVMTPQ